jgi:hypothetical protein
VLASLGIVKQHSIDSRRNSLQMSNFWADYHAMRARGVQFIEEAARRGIRLGGCVPRSLRLQKPATSLMNEGENAIICDTMMQSILGSSFPL